ncbi:hypothetical protein GUJ93_ZPchr0001g32207 [Zizania palustris]|uniref:Uncharacterized protein n=1 Tax=Zizania palustris TaxID=103762 RepID=A0A8J5UZH7_ZIZPA|nr:hypothetical protein GUJ93_ZPchr0001g32207 [Zizania palustris]
MAGLSPSSPRIKVAACDGAVMSSWAPVLLASHRQPPRPYPRIGADRPRVHPPPREVLWSSGWEDPSGATLSRIIAAYSGVGSPPLRVNLTSTEKRPTQSRENASRLWLAEKGPSIGDMVFYHMHSSKAQL